MAQAGKARSKKIGSNTKWILVQSRFERSLGERLQALSRAEGLTVSSFVRRLVIMNIRVGAKDSDMAPIDGSENDSSVPIAYGPSCDQADFHTECFAQPTGSAL